MTDSVHRVAAALRTLSLVVLVGGGVWVIVNAAQESGYTADLFTLRVLASLVVVALIALLLRLPQMLTQFDASDRSRPRSEDGGIDPEASTASVTFEQTIVGTAEVDRTGTITAVNTALINQTGRTRDQLLGTKLVSLTHEQDRARQFGEIDALLTGRKSQSQLEHRYIKADGTELWVSEHITRSGVGDNVRLLVQCQDITYRRQATWELAKQALHDELTGLPNRAMLLYRLRSALSSTDSNQLVGAMFIDVDRFKVVNDSLGHEVGDQLIKHVASRLGTAVRHGDSVSRFGGDEFVVLTPALVNKSEAMAIAERMRRSLQEPFVVDRNKIHPTLSIGVATCAPGEQSADELLRDADAAMYRAKERGRDRIEMFDEGMRDKLVERMELESELRTAIRNEDLSMYYQSLVDLSTGYTVGFESLIRWVHPTRGLLSPGQFLPTAEEAGLQSAIDGVALRKTATQLAEWNKVFPAARNLYVSSNIVPKNFMQFVDRIDDALIASGLPPHQLMIEVVENELLDDADGSLNAIQALKELGVSIAIDDFGTGFSSLSYLTQFKPDKLKIDRSFVSRLPEDRATGTIIQAITSMAQALDITVIAEGVETHEQAAILRSMGVPLGQGFLFAKPRPPEEISGWFTNDHVQTGNATESTSGLWTPAI